MPSGPRRFASGWPARALGDRRGRRGHRLTSLPAADQFFRIDQRHEDRRSVREPSPACDPVVEFPDDLAHGLLGAQVLNGLGQPLALLAQLERGRQRILGLGTPSRRR